MAKLPYSRAVNVTLSRQDAFPSRRGFGVPLILTNVSVAGEVDEIYRTKVYSGIDEVVVDHASNTPVYAAAEAAFMQNPRPMQIKVGYVSFTAGTTTAEQMKTSLDSLFAYDGEWYWLTAVAAFRDSPSLPGLFEWVEAKGNKFAIIASNDENTTNAVDTTSIAGAQKGKFERSAVFYHPHEDEYPDVALAAVLATRNFDEADSAYTAKFKRLNGITPANLGSAAVQGATGFTPALGQSNVAGNMANMYIDIGGRDFVVEGSTLTANVFIDEVHATDWIVQRTEEETLGILLNAARVPFSDVGMEQLASAARTVMRQADRAGLIANDLDERGEYSPAVIFDIPSVFDVPASQRKARIAPEIKVTFRYAGAVHYTTIHYRMMF